MSAAHPLSGWLRLTLTPGLGPASQRQLLAAFGLPEAIYSATPRALAAVVGEATSRLLLEHDADAAVNTALAWVAESGNTVLTDRKSVV